MYIPTHFAAPGKDALHDLIRAYPFATLVMTTATGVEVSHLPLYLDGNGVLTGHLARANPLWQAIQGDTDVLAVFHGPHTYISPSYYPSKARTGMVIPTWNYVVVHARGKLRVIEDVNWLRAHLEALTAQHEAGYAEPWQLEDAPAGFIDKLMQAVVGIEMTIIELIGKWKVSQNQPLENQMGVVRGLSASDDEYAQKMAAVVKAVNHLTG